MTAPSVGRIVHYNHDRDCTAAIITAVTDEGPLLTLFRSTGPEAHLTPIPEGDRPGTWHWPERT